MKASSVFALFVAAYTPAAYSGAISCDDISNAEKSSEIYNDRITTTAATISPRLDSILRQALIIHEALTYSEVKELSTKQLFEDYNPIFSEYTIGSARATGVNLDLGDNSFIYLFKGIQFTGVSQQDGTVMVGKAWCELTTSDVL